MTTRLHIDGEWLDGGGTGIPTNDPSEAAGSSRRFGAASRADVDAAVSGRPERIASSRVGQTCRPYGAPPLLFTLADLVEGAPRRTGRSSKTRDQGAAQSTSRAR